MSFRRGDRWGLVCLGLVLVGVGPAAGQSKLKLETGKQIFEAGCAGCHGADGKGAPDTTVGFEKPETFPDFTKCDQTTPELDVDWRATITQGGHGRSFSPIMPSFSEMLTADQINKVIGYLRTFCKDSKWPRGEFNLPRPLVTEKAFPEDEFVMVTSINAHGAPGVSNNMIYEKRLSARNQLEIDIPTVFAHQDSGAWFGGVGDVSLGLKRVLLANFRTGSIWSVQGGAVLPTGNKARGFGSGVTTFEGFTSFAQLFPGNSFVQFQAGLEQPTHMQNVPRAAYWRTAVGKSFRQEQKMGRMWTPMVEWVASRDFRNGARVSWDVVPEFQVTLSRRQHVRFNVGVDIPATNTAGRNAQVVFYLLWDWFDGSLFEGWR